MSAPVICPTITAESSEQYELEMNKVGGLATRLHIDIADGVLAPRRLLDPEKLWWPGNKQIDIHVMYQRPQNCLELFIVQRPCLVIVHAEAEGNFMQFAEKLRQHGIKVGVALLPQTPVAQLVPALPLIDHVLIFSGNLGYQGGSTADLRLLSKAAELRKLKTTIELGWDGGIDAMNIGQLVRGGINVLNVGGYFQRAPQPEKAYATLESVMRQAA